ncbi:large ribosomal subunit protein uL5 [Candidatus Nasuia deltocephalinicola]|uniref:large ribosomal subunit protein uL5 n=1 Tax=Candidatus Nasuia deltocephalincola TaxID=1160784 RepID=UPI00216B1B3D|nr:50S ribosomal protein L5 [Candidatus Nasuia deltocephalinicola]
MSYFMKIYKEKIFWDLYYNYKFKNIMQIPYILKINLNSCCGNFFFDKKKINSFFLNINNICNQKPVFVKCKKSISEFKIKKNDNIAIKLTLRKKNMYNFLYKILNLSLPLIKSFEGLSVKSFDNFGNYNFGIKDYSIFPEVDSTISDLNFNIGLNISIVFKNSNIEKSFTFLNYLNFPFKDV